MKIEENREFRYNCQDTQELLALYAACPEELSQDERDELAVHLSKCPSCSQDYEGMKIADNMLRANQDFLQDSEVFDNNSYDLTEVDLTDKELAELRFEAMIDRALTRRKRRESKEKAARFRLILKSATTIAACLRIGFLACFVAKQFNNKAMGPDLTANQQNTVKIQDVSGNIAEIMAAGQLISADSRKTITINNNRQMILDEGTELFIDTYQGDGCIVKLDKGRIFTEVEHDGKPFIVETSHGRAVITGTTFNISNGSDFMDLVVVEGSVRFESAAGTVNVNGGYKSTIAKGTAPMNPISCDTSLLTMWAKGHVEKKIKSAESNESIQELVSLQPTCGAYCNLEDIDFEVWTEHRRGWFEREFPWTKRLQELLAAEKIEVDTIDLLIESADMLRFAWPEKSSRQLLAQDQKAIEQMAGQYGIEIKKLIPTGHKDQKRKISSVKALEKWYDAISRNQNSLTIDSIHAATFLINTRSLTWYGVKSQKIKVKDRTDALEKLQEQVKLASGVHEILNKMLLADINESVCSAAQYNEYVRDLKENISAMIEIEKELVKNEIKSK